MFSLFKHKVYTLMLHNSKSIILPLVHYQTTSMQLPKLQKDSIYTMNTFCLKYSMYIFPLHMDTVSSPTFHYAAG